MAKQISVNIILSKEDSLSPFISPSVVEILTERLKELCAQLEAKDDENYQLKKSVQKLKNARFEEEMKKAIAYENIAQLAKQITPTKAPVIDLAPMGSTRGWQRHVGVRPHSDSPDGLQDGGA